MDDKELADLVAQVEDGDNDYITINLDHTMGATTSYCVSDMDSITFHETDLELDWSGINIQGFDFEQTKFENCMPHINEIKSMCEVYPGLKKSFENFKTAYKLVEQDYKGKLESGEISKDDDIF